MKGYFDISNKAKTQDRMNNKKKKKISNIKNCFVIFILNCCWGKQKATKKSGFMETKIHSRNFSSCTSFFCLLLLYFSKSILKWKLCGSFTFLWLSRCCSKKNYLTTQVFNEFFIFFGFIFLFNFLLFFIVVWNGKSFPFFNSLKE